MNGGWFQEQDRIMAEINITPLVDVALVLLIIFMITAPMMVQGADVRLPETRPMDTLPDSQVVVALTADGRILLNGEEVALEDFEARVSPLVTPGRTVHFHGDTEAAYGSAMAVMAILQRLQANVGLVIEPIPERR